jgi:serine/threonine protein kinase
VRGIKQQHARERPSAASREDEKTWLFYQQLARALRFRSDCAANRRNAHSMSLRDDRRLARGLCAMLSISPREPPGLKTVPPYMAQQTHFERLNGREATAPERARTAPTFDDHGDDTDTFQITEDTGPAAAPASDDSPDEWQVGDIAAGRFVLQQRLGRGRYGPVFKALDRASSDPSIGVEHHVVLQGLPPWIAERATFIECLKQLRLHPQSWSHPNIAKVLEFGRDGDRYFVCEQLLQGASLRVVLDASAPDPLEEHEVLGILRYVGDALNYSHAKGIVHGDLRLDNVFVTEAYEVKLTGFLPSTEPRPEPVFVEDPTTGCQPHPSDDVYGLACLAYELLTRRHPYGGKTPLEALRAGLTAVPVPKLSPERWQALSRGVGLRRGRRTATIPELLAGLGVTGVETLHPAAKDVASTASPRAPSSEETTAWPELTPAEPARRSPRFVASAAAGPVSERFAAERPGDPFAEIYPEPRARLMRGRPRRRRASPARTVLGVVLVAGAATFAYQNHAWLRDRAAGLLPSRHHRLSHPRRQSRLRCPGRPSRCPHLRRPSRCPHLRRPSRRHQRRCRRPPQSLSQLTRLLPRRHRSFRRPCRLPRSSRRQLQSSRCRDSCSSSARSRSTNGRAARAC